MVGCTRGRNSGYYNRDGSLVTQQQAIDLTEDLWTMFDLVFISSDIVKRHTEFNQQSGIGGPFYSPDYDSWCIVMSPDPVTVNSTQIYHYVFVNAKSGKVEIDNESREFDNQQYKWIVLKHPENQSPSTDPGFIYIDHKRAASTRSGYYPSHKWAVIIGGGGDVFSNYIRYWNDCSAIFSILCYDYAYYKDHVYLLVSDGDSPASDINLCTNVYYDGFYYYFNGPYVSSPTDYDNDGYAEINLYSATKSNLQTVFTELGGLVESTDDVFIFVTDHGIRNNNTSYLLLWNNETLSQSEFRTEIDKLQNDEGRVHVLMGQCYSGGFINSLTRSNVTISTAASATETSHARSNLHYDEFLYHWMSAMHGEELEAEEDELPLPIDGNLDGLMGLSFGEVFAYAQDADGTQETPQYRSNPSATGLVSTLETDQFPMPYITGPDHISNATSGVYTLHGAPPGSSIAWNNSSAISYSSPTSSVTSAVCSINYPFLSTSVSATIAIESMFFFDIERPVNLWGVGSYEDSELIYGDDGVFELYCPVGGYGFYWESSNSHWEAMSQGYRYVDFDTNNEPATWVSCSYYTPLGNWAKVIKYLTE